MVMSKGEESNLEFESWDSYQAFRRSVQSNRRFVWEERVVEFLATVLGTAEKRSGHVRKGRRLYRAQAGVRYIEEEGQFEIAALGSKRMKPKPSVSRQGRANPSRIPVLYLASSKMTAVSEIRPWIGAEVTVADFKVIRDLRSIVLPEGTNDQSFLHLSIRDIGNENEISADKKEACVWADIGHAFSQPVSDDLRGPDYVPTQILSELFKGHGYDAIIYRSQFGKEGFNVALFNLEDAEPVRAVPCRVSGMELTIEEMGSGWIRRRSE